MTQALEDQVDWERAKSFLQGAVGSRWYRDPGDVDELVQVCLVRLLRASRRGTIDNPDALMNAIAKRVVIDELRRRTRWQAIMEPASESNADRAQSPQDPEAFGDPVSRVRFLVLNFFGAGSCGGLARAYFQELNWEAVAGNTGTSHAAIRKQWSRCLQKLRDAVRSNPSMSILKEWAEA